MEKLIADTIKRALKPHHMIAPMFIYYSYFPSDFLYDRNIKRFRDLV